MTGDRDDWWERPDQPHLYDHFRWSWPRRHHHAIRAVSALIVLLLSALPVERARVGDLEADVFAAINELPGWLYPPVWLVMQLGNLFAVPVVVVVALLLRRPRLAIDLGVAGSLAWTLARVVKETIVRARPSSLLQEVIVRGPAADGQGYVSGHTAVAFALATVASAYLDRRGEIVVWTLAAIVALSRLYVGAHLPLDVIGGGAMGWAIGSLVHLALGAPHPRRPKEIGSGEKEEGKGV